MIQAQQALFGLLGSKLGACAADDRLVRAEKRFQGFPAGFALLPDGTLSIR
jgi:hypothetical protein